MADWDVTLPVDHTKISAVPGAIRDVTSSAKIVLAKEHVSPSTSNAGGQHLKGSVRVYLDSAAPTTDPEGNSLDTSATSDDGRLAVLTGSSNALQVYKSQTTGVSTGWQNVAARRVYLADTMNANSVHIVGLPTATQSGSPVHVGQFDTAYFQGVSTGTLQPKLAINAIGTGLATSAQTLYVAMTPVAYTGGESITLPNGYIIKCGADTVSNSGGTTIAFVTPFANAVKSGHANFHKADTGSAEDLAIETIETGAIRILLNSDSDREVYWTVYGY